LVPGVAIIGNGQIGVKDPGFDQVVKIGGGLDKLGVGELYPACAVNGAVTPVEITVDPLSDVFKKYAERPAFQTVGNKRGDIPGFKLGNRGNDIFPGFRFRDSGFFKKTLVYINNPHIAGCGDTVENAVSLAAFQRAGQIAESGKITLAEFFNMAVFDERVHHSGDAPPLKNIRQLVGCGVGFRFFLPNLILAAFNGKARIGAGRLKFGVNPLKNQTGTAVPVRVVIARFQGDLSGIPYTARKNQRRRHKEYQQKNGKPFHVSPPKLEFYVYHASR
jgi:hypothetical protein